LKITNAYPTYFLKNDLNQEGSIAKLEKGEMIHFDLAKRTYTHLP